MKTPSDVRRGALFLSAIAANLAVLTTSARSQLINDSSLILHYDASDLNGDGVTDAPPAGLVRVDQWNDKSASAAHAVRSGTNENVFLFPSTLHGRPTVHFGTTHLGGTAGIDHLDSGTLTAEQITGPNRDEISVFMVTRRHANVVHFQWQTAGSNRVGFEGASRWDFVNDVATTGGNLSALFALRGEPYIFGAVRTPASAVTSPRTQFQYYNGTQDVNTRQTALTLAAGTASQWGIGTQSTSAGSGNPSHVDYGDIAVYNRALSAAERQQVEAYFKKKYFMDANSLTNGVYVNKSASVIRRMNPYAVGMNSTGAVLALAAAENADKGTDSYSQTKVLFPVTTTAVPSAAAPYYLTLLSASGQPVTVSDYTIVSANDAPARDPKDWVLQGSNDGSFGGAWTDIDTQAGVIWTTRFERKNFTVASPAPFLHHRLKLTANSGDASLAANLQFADLILNTSQNPLNYVASSTTATVAERLYSALDGRTDTKFITAAGTNPAASIHVQFPAGEIIRAYAVASANDTPGRDPRNWLLEGSSDGAAWTTLDTQTNVAWQARYQLKEFNIPNSTAWTYYRLNVTHNWGEPLLQFAEFQLFNYSATTDSDGDGAADAREFQEFGNLSTLLAGDDDTDTLPNGWEFTHFGAIVSAADATTNEDSDGAPNAQELSGGGNPKMPDTDGDGRTDGQEQTAGTGMNNRDSDNDGLTDGQESAAGTNPLLTDTDGDGKEDSLETAMGFNPLLNTSTPAIFDAISINFADNDIDLITPKEVVGPYGYLARNWNNVAGRSSAAPYSSNLTSVVSHSGATVAMTVDWVSPGTFRFNNTNFNNYNTATKRLLNGYLDDSTTDGAQSVTLTGIPYARYHVIVFTEGDNAANSNSGSYRILDNTGTTTLAAKRYLQNSGGLDTSIQLTDGSTGTTGLPFGNAVIFRDLTASGIRVQGLREAAPIATRSPIGAIMIVPFDPTTDSDGDTVPDEREIVAYQSLEHGASSDTDGDGLTLAQEVTAGTNPNNRDTDNDGLADGAEAGVGGNPILADTDSDGLIDGTEVKLGTGPGTADTDGDTYTDGIEFALGSLPTLNTSIPPADLLFYEGFSNIFYGNGPLLPQRLTGLYSQTNITLANGNTDIQEDSLRFAALRTTPQRLWHYNRAGSANSTDTFANLDVSATSRFNTAGLINGGFVGGGTTAGTVYLSFLQRCNRIARIANGDLDGGNAFFGFQIYRDATEVQGFGEATGTATTAGNNQSFAVGGDLNFTPNVPTDNRTHLWVVKLTFNSGVADDMKVWIDPDPTLPEASQTGPSATRTAPGDLSFNRLAWRGRATGSDHSIDHDEVRMGTTWSAVLPVDSSALVISEFSATGGLEDEDGNNEDWIEITNGTASAVDLNGYKLSDSAATWIFPARILNPGQILVVFASDKDPVKRPFYGPASELHTNFRLTSAGENLRFLDPADVVLSSFLPYPGQTSNYTYGSKDGVTGYMIASPGAANFPASPTPVPVLAVSQDSGVFTAPFAVTVSGQGVNQTVRYTLDGSIPGISNGFTYTGPVSISTTSQFRCRVAEASRTGPISSEIYLFVNAGAAGAQPDPVSSYNLPAVVVDTHGRTIIKGDSNTNEWPSECSYAIYDAVAGGLNMQTAVPSIFSRGQVSVRGKTSSGEAKRGFNVEFWQEENNEDNNRSVLGLPADSDWVLYAGDSFDKNGMRNTLMYDLSRQTGNYATNCRFVELWVNETGGNLASAHYYGVYVLMEKPNRSPDRVDVEEMTPFDNAEPDVSGGYIFQINKLFATPTSDLRFGAGTYVPATGADFLLEYPEEDQATVAQRTYLNTLINEIEDCINANPGGAPTFTHPVTGKHFRDYIDVPNWVDHHILCVAANNVDGLRLSGKMYKPRGGKVFCGPVWDFDRSIESNDGRDDNPNAWVGTGDATKFFLYGWWKGQNDPAAPGNNSSPHGITHGLFKDADFKQLWVDRWVVLRRTGQPFHISNVNALLDSYEQQQFPTGSSKNPALRNIARWSSVNAPRGGTFQNETVIMKNWLASHFIFIDGRILATPAFDVNGGAITTSTPITLSSADLTGVAKIYYTTDGTDPRLPGGGVNPAATEFTAAFTLPAGHRLVRTRLFKSDEAAFDYSNVATRMSTWSGLNEAYFFTDAVAAGSGNLVVSELMYHPADPSPAEITAGYFDSDVFEYIELLNIGASPIDLFESAFSSGIDYHFRNGTITQLAPGERLLIVKNLAAFTFRNGAAAAARVAGVFEGNDNFNNNGETVTITDRLGAVILSFTYDDLAPWPLDADGLGRSLVLMQPETNPDESLSANWRASVISGGEPAGVDSRTFFGVATDDNDRDGLTALVEHVNGTSDNDPFSVLPPVASLLTVGADQYQALTFLRDRRADGVSVRAQRSTDLTAWNTGAGETVVVSTTQNPDGTETIVYRSAVPYESSAREYLRVQVSRP